MDNGRGGRVAGDYGTIYGKKITAEAYRNAQTEFFLSYWFRSNGEWPDKNPNFTDAVMAREIYIRVMLLQKASDLGIHVGEDAVVTAASGMLRSISPNHQAVPPAEFVKRFLSPRGMTAGDFQTFVREDLIMEQLQQAIGQTGGFITPQEAAEAYQRDYQEFSAQVVFFSASNYQSSVTVNPAVVAQFYTNYLAEYRLPDRVQISYVAFEVSNFLAQARAEWAKTNFDAVVENYFRQVGADYENSKSPDEAKARIREDLIRSRAAKDASEQANDFASVVFGQEPVRPENLNAVAKQKGLAVHVTAPFAASFGPDEFTAPPGFIKAAFALTPDEPFAGPVAGPDAVYVLAFGKQFPSEIPPLDQIRARVTRDYQLHTATLLAQQAGTNFVHTLTGVTADRGFAALCVSAGLHPQMLPPFSLRGTREMPELGDPAVLNQLKEAAFTTPLGKTSNFQTTSDGGFVIYVQSRLPVDQAKMHADLPQYLAAFRRERLNEAFNQWVNLEANRQLRDTPVFAQQFAPGAAN